jgi:hypothetical protein
MKNRFDVEEVHDNYAIYSDGTVRIAMKTIVNSLHAQHLSIVETPSVWGEQSPINFIIPELKEKFNSTGLERLALGAGGIEFLQRPVTAWEEHECNGSGWKLHRVFYQLMRNVPRDEIQTFGYDWVLEGDFREHMKKYKVSEEDIREDVSPRILKWVGEQRAPYVVSVNMACAYGFDDIPEELQRQVKIKRHEIAEKYDLLLGHTGCVPAQHLGYGVNVAAFTLIPKDLDVIEMEKLFGAINDIRMLARNIG